MAKQITFDRDAREALMQGAKKFARAVKSTLGPRGRYAVMDRGFGTPRVTKDGASVAQEIELTDPVQNVAVRLLHEAAKKTSEGAGDGTTTSTVLAEAIFLRGMRNIIAGANPVALQRGVNIAAQRVIDALKKLATPVHGTDRVATIAATASNNNPQVGKVIADAIDRVGKDGIITIEEGKSMETSVEIVEGMQFDRGYLSQYFITDEANASTVLKNPYVLILEDKISSLSQILPILEKVLKSKKPLLIVAEDVEGEALSTLVVNKQRGVLACVAVKAPGYGDRRKAMLEDVAIVTGGKALFKDLGIEPASVRLEDLGQAERVEVNSETTTIIKGAGESAKIQERARQIRLELEKTDSTYDKEKLQERLARLVGGVAQINVGGATETEVKERKKLFENALSSTRAALEEGIVPGGGIAYLRCTSVLEDATPADGDERLAFDIVKFALEAPFRQLAKNAAVEPSHLLRKMRGAGSKVRGYDFEKKTECDMLEAGIIDSLRVSRLALQNAASVAGMLFTTDCVVTSIPKKAGEDAHQHEHPEYNDMDF